MRKDLEAENEILRARFQQLQHEANRAHDRFGPSWLFSFARQALEDADKAREAAAKECRRKVSPGERRQRVADAFTGKGSGK